MEHAKEVIIKGKRYGVTQECCDCAPSYVSALEKEMTVVEHPSLMGPFLEEWKDIEDF